MNKRLVRLLVSSLMLLILVTCLSISALAAEHSEDDPRIVMQDGQGNEEIIWFQGLYTLPECPYTAPEGQRFKCWMIDGKKSMQPGEQIYTDYRTVITAVWEPLPVVSFAANGGTKAMDAVPTEGDYTLPECGFTAPEDQQFKCWLVDGKEKLPGDVITVDADITVTAVWELLPVITFASGEGTGTMESVAIVGEYTLPKCLFAAPEGQQFKGWLVDGQEKLVGDVIQVEADITVIAAWEEIPVVESTSQTAGTIETTEASEAQQASNGNNDAGHPWWIFVLVAVAGVAVGVLVVLLTLKKKKD